MLLIEDFGEVINTKTGNWAPPPLVPVLPSRPGYGKIEIIFTKRRVAGVIDFIRIRTLRG